MPETMEATTEFVDFWNEVLAPKFIKYRHILVGGLTHHSPPKSGGLSLTPCCCVPRSTEETVPVARIRLPLAVYYEDSARSA